MLLKGNYFKINLMINLIQKKEIIYFSTCNIINIKQVNIEYARIISFDFFKKSY